MIDADKIRVHLPTLEMMQMNQRSPCWNPATKNGQFEIPLIVKLTDAIYLNDEDGPAGKHIIVTRPIVTVVSCCVMLSGHIHHGD